MANLRDLLIRPTPTSIQRGNCSFCFSFKVFDFYPPVKLRQKTNSFSLLKEVSAILPQLA